MAFADCYTVLYRLSADPFDAPFEPSGGVPVADSEKGSMLDHVYRQNEPNTLTGSTK